MERLGSQSPEIELSWVPCLVHTAWDTQATIMDLHGLNTASKTGVTAKRLY